MKILFPSFFVNFLLLVIFPNELTREKILEQFTFTQKLCPKFYNINRALETNIPGSEHAMMM